MKGYNKDFMKGQFLKQTIIFAVSLMILNSCWVSKPFITSSITSDSLYRDIHTADTATIANISYGSMFKDTYLQNLIRAGIANNYNLKVAVARIKQADANFQQSNLAFLPGVNSNTQVTQQRLSNTQGGGFSYNDRIYQLGMNTSWEADLWGKLKSSKKAALANLMQSEAYRRFVQTQLISSIASAYFTLMAYDKQLLITIQTVQNRKADVETNKALKDANRITGAAVAQSEANLHAAEVTIPDLQNSIRQIENTLSVLTARQPGVIERDSLDRQQYDVVLQTGIPAQLLSNRPDVQEAEYSIRYYFEQVNVARAYFYPTLTISAQGGWQTATIKNLFNTSALFGNLVGSLTQPIFNKGLNKQRLEIAKAQYEEKVAVFQQTVLTAGQEVSNALFSYQTALNKSNTRSLQLEAWKKAVEYNRELLKNGFGRTSYTDVLTSEQGYLSAQLNKISDQLQQLIAVVNLYVSLGGGWR